MDPDDTIFGENVFKAFLIYSIRPIESGQVAVDIISACTQASTMSKTIHTLVLFVKRPS